MDFACEYGVECAIIINYLQRSIREKYGRPSYFHEGKIWTKFTKSKLFSAFPYWRLREPEKFLNILVDKNVIEIKKFYSSDHGRYFWISFVDCKRFAVDDGYIESKQNSVVMRYDEERRKNL